MRTTSRHKGMGQLGTADAGVAFAGGCGGPAGRPFGREAGAGGCDECFGAASLPACDVASASTSASPGGVPVDPAASRKHTDVGFGKAVTIAVNHSVLPLAKPQLPGSDLSASSLAQLGRWLPPALGGSDRGAIQGVGGGEGGRGEGPLWGGCAEVPRQRG